MDEWDYVDEDFRQGAAAAAAAPYYETRPPSIAILDDGTVVPIGPYHFPTEPLFERVTQLTAGDYPEAYLAADIPAGPNRIAKRRPRPSSESPFSAALLREFGTLQQGGEAWRAARNVFLSSSRFGVIVGEWPQHWDTPIDFWRESTGRTPPKVYDALHLSWMAHGVKYEPIARSVYNRVVGYEAAGIPLQEEGLRVDLRPPYIYSASPDGIGDNHLIEIKCRAIGAMYSEPPYYYLPQIIGATAIYRKEFSEFVGYWARDSIKERFMYVCRIYFDEAYWRQLKLRLNYMAWCIVHDVAPTGALELAKLHPLPEVRMEDQYWYQGVAEADDDPTATLPGLTPETVEF